MGLKGFEPWGCSQVVSENHLKTNSFRRNELKASLISGCLLHKTNQDQRQSQRNVQARAPTHGNGKRTITRVEGALLLGISILLLLIATLLSFHSVGVSSHPPETAQVLVKYTAMVHASAGTGLAVTCQTTPPASNFILLGNSGTAKATVMAVSLTYGNNSYSGALTGCSNTPVIAGSTLYLAITRYPPLASSAGQQYNGSVTFNNGLLNGAQVFFAGAFA